MKLSIRWLGIIWGVLYGLCALLSLDPTPSAPLRAVQLLCMTVFFVPGAVLLYRGIRSGNRRLCRRIRRISIAWLCVAAVLLVLNVSSAGLSRSGGDFLHYAMMIASAPIGCSRSPLLPVFLWACLLYASFLKPQAK